MRKVSYIIFDNFEEIESIVPIDLLRRAEANVEIISLNDKIETKGRSDIKILADKCLDDIDPSFDMLVVSGGAGVFEAIKNTKLLELIKNADANNKTIAAICAAPLILKEAGVLKTKCTGHSSIIEKLGDTYISQACVEDKNIITSQGAGTAFDFAFKLIETLFNKTLVEEIKTSICYKS